VLEADLDHLLQLREEKATTCRGLLSLTTSQILTTTLCLYLAITGPEEPSKPLDLSLPRSATELDELLFQEGRPVTVTPLDK
jgi:hypothetical protein